MCRTKQLSKVWLALVPLLGVVARGGGQPPCVIAASATDQSTTEEYLSDGSRELLIQLDPEANVPAGPRSGLSQMKEQWTDLGAVEVIPVFQVDPSSEAQRELRLDRFLLVRLARGFDASVQARDFEALSEVVWAQPNTAGRKVCTPGVPLDRRQWSYINPGFNFHDTTGLTYRIVFDAERARVEGGAQIDEVRLQGVPGAFPPPGGWKPEGPVTVTLFIEGDPFEAFDEETSICEVTQR